jgi:undecaprenyl-diphosphatase
MIWLKAVLLGALQGLTEFLPVSSSGHLVLGRRLLGVASPEGASAVLWEVTLHAGTLLAVLIVFRRDIVALVRGFFRGLGLCRRGVPFAVREDPDFALGLWILLGSVPAGAVGLCFRDFFEGLTRYPFGVAAALAVTGVVLYLTRFARPTRPDGRVGWRDAIWIGAAQAVAIAPGISRSGSTISAGLFRGVDRGEAARFSFLLSVPAVGGAVLLECRHLERLPVETAAPILLGGVVAAAVGVPALVLLARLVRGGRLYAFAWYCWAVAAVGMVGLALA